MAFSNVSHLLIVCVQVIAYANMYRTRKTYITICKSTFLWNLGRWYIKFIFLSQKTIHKYLWHSLHLFHEQYMYIHILFRRYRYYVWRKYIVLHCCSMHILLTPFTIQNALLARGGGGRGGSIPIQTSEPIIFSQK
jgi:hypothetical protein